MVLNFKSLTFCNSSKLVLIKHEAQQVCKVVAYQVCWEVKLLLKSVLKHLGLICGVKGRKACYHLEKDRADTVIIDAIAVGLSIQHLR